MKSGTIRKEGKGLDYEPCGARKKTGDKSVRCLRRPCPGSKRCKFHGGMTPKGIDSPHFKHGKRSKYAKEQVIQRIKRFKNDQDARDLRDELAILRGVLDSYIDASNENAPILSDESVRTIVSIIDKIEKVVSALKVIEEGQTFTIKNVNNVLLQVVKIIKVRVKDPKTRSIIANDLKGLSYISMN